MGSWSDSSLDGKAKRSANYRVRFRHGVYPNAEGLATRADIKKYDYFFDGGQTWVDTTGSVDFIDESAQVAADVGSGETSGESYSRRISKKTHRREAAERMSKAVRPATSIASIHAYSLAPSTTSNSPQDMTFVCHGHPSPAVSCLSTSSLEGILPELPPDVLQPSRLPHISQTAGTSWPLSDPIEAQLFRFWVETVTAWFDITSPHNVFKEVIPQMALSNRMLLNAVLMVAGQHIQCFDSSFPAKPYLYHERVLQELIPNLAKNGTIEDEAVLVSAILLRAFEEFYAGTRGQAHLSTFELFQGNDGWQFNMSSPVVQACFMVHVHFEIYQALLYQSNLRVDYRTFALPTLASPVDDVSWENQIVWICGRILQFVYSDGHTLDNWHSLKQMVDKWERERPHSFNAYFTRHADFSEGRSLPELWFSNLCHADAHQHLRICRLALATSYVEPGRSLARQQEIERNRQIEAAEWLREMIAIARCNSFAKSAPAIAAHAIHRFGREIKDSMDRKNAISFLEEVEASGWPTSSTRQWLRAQWR